MPAPGESINITLPLPHVGQQRVIAESKRFNVLDCGRRFGKTLFGRDRLIRVAIQSKPVGWFSPTNKVLADTWREMKTALLPLTVDKSEDEHRLALIGGGVVEMWSLESEDAGRSRKYAEVVIDEAAMAPKLKKAWQENIRPTLTDYQGGAWFLSTPKGMNYFKTLFDYGQDPTRESWASWQMPTSTNPHIKESEIEEARRDMTEAAFNQEYLALFINWEGSVFRNVEECATGNLLEGPEPGHNYIIGVDWGRSHDYTVFVVIDETSHAVVHLDRSNRVDYAIQRGRLRVLRDLWQPSCIIAESNSIGQPIIEQLRGDGIRVTSFETTNSSKQTIIQHLALAFERRDIVIPNNPILVGELVAFQGEILPSGLTRYAAPGDDHDDTVMALAVGWSKVAHKAEYGAMKAMRDQDHQLAKIQQSKLIKPVVSAQAPHCPECEAVCVVRLGTGFHCNQCGHSFGMEAVEPAHQKRGEMLAKGSGGEKGWRQQVTYHGRVRS